MNKKWSFKKGQLIPCNLQSGALVLKRGGLGGTYKRKKSQKDVGI